MMKNWITVAVAIVLGCGYAQGQTGAKIELIRADVLKFDKSLGVDAQRLIGDVRFRHEGALMYCDSAYLYNASNSLEAFGDVRVVQGDSLSLTSDKLHYNGNTKLVKVRDNATLSDSDMTLRTHTLDYDRNTGLAVFYDRGIITSRRNDNRLVSCEGTYASNTEMFYFRDSVVLDNPDYRMETDTLHYSNRSEVAYFFGPTFIFSDANTIYCENGWYDTRNDVSQFEDNAYLDNGKQVLRGDSLWYDRNAGVGLAYENVEVIDTSGHYLIKGQFGRHLSKAGRSLVTGRAEMIQYDRGDSLFLHGDTLLAVRDSLHGDRVLAYPGVRFFSADMQGASDSLVYMRRDSLIMMYTDPVLWSQDLQITGDTIAIKAFGGVVDKLYVYEHAFMANRVDSTKYNQIKGKRLTGYFRNNDLYKALVQGNGQSLYYAAEETEAENADMTETGDTARTTDLAPPPPDSASTAADTLATSADTTAATSSSKSKARVGQKFIGVNKAACSSILIHLEDRQVKRIVFLTQPDGTFYPMGRLPEEDKFFRGFDWQGTRRPMKRTDIFVKPEG